MQHVPSLSAGTFPAKSCHVWKIVRTQSESKWIFLSWLMQCKIDRSGRGVNYEQHRKTSSIFLFSLWAAKLLCIVLHRLYLSLSSSPMINIAWYSSHLDYHCNEPSVIHSLPCVTRTYCVWLDYCLSGHGFVSPPHVSVKQTWESVTV